MDSSDSRIGKQVRKLGKLSTVQSPSEALRDYLLFRGIEFRLCGDILKVALQPLELLRCDGCRAWRVYDFYRHNSRGRFMRLRA